MEETSATIRVLLEVNFEGEEKVEDDLEAVGIPYIIDGPDGPLYADFHSLRHAYVSGLARGGVSPKHAQELARHCDIHLTMMRYTHATLHDQGAAVDSLPSIVPCQSQPERQVLRATGTDGAEPVPKNLAFYLARNQRLEETSVGADGRNAEQGLVSQSLDLQGKTLIPAGKTEYARRGSNPQPAVPKTVEFHCWKTYGSIASEEFTTIEVSLQARAKCCEEVRNFSVFREGALQKSGSYRRSVETRLSAVSRYLT